MFRLFRWWTPAVTLPVLFFVLAANSFGSGLIVPVWTDWYAKTVPEHMWGRLLGLRRVFSSALGLGIGAFIGWVLERPHSFLSMTMRSQYKNQYTPGIEQRDRFRSDGGVNDWLFVYPMAKTKDWYQSSSTRRNRAMTEHVEIGHAYPEIKINTTYSYGLDDQEFVVAFEGDSPGQFLALVKDLRVSDSTSFTEFDTPMFTCRRMSVAELVDHVGLGQGVQRREPETSEAQPAEVSGS